MVRRTRLAVRIRRLRGWRGAFGDFLAGALSALGFAPFDLFPLLLLGFAWLVLRIDDAGARRRRLRAAFTSGWWFGFGQFLVGLHWIGFAFLVDAEAHAWQLPFVALLFPGGLALFPALAALAARALWRKGEARIFVFALCFGLAEWLRGHVLTGFPWNISAYGWGAMPWVMQGAALVGSYGLSLVTILFGASLAELATARRRLPVALTALFTFLCIFGAVRMMTTPTRSVDGVRLRIVQPDIPQNEKYDPRYVMRNWRRLTDLTMQKGTRTPTIVIWPEAAPPFRLAFVPDAMAWVADLNARGIQLMTGSIRSYIDDDGDFRTSNSFYLFDGGMPVAVYDKAHLVPFGEYLPFEKTLENWGLKKLTGIPGSFAAGEGPRTIAVLGAPPASPLICYEILFPGDVVGTKRPGWFVNVTDDSWFGPWAGPHQHLLVARMRAIEEGIPVVRAANTGISAIIDPLGRITAQTSLNRQTILDGTLLSEIEITPYASFRWGWFWLLWAAVLLAAHVQSGRKVTQMP